MIDLKDHELILAAGSPRRKELLSSFQIPFIVQPSLKEEDFPDSLDHPQVPEFLAQLKAHDVLDQCSNKSIVIGADTIVVLNDQILGKPKDRMDAIKMLSNLSDTQHSVYTGVCIATKTGQTSFTDQTVIHFNALSSAEVERYIDECQPFDKAGAYGIQDWIGREKIKRMEGDYFNVMGFPVTRTHIELKILLEQLH